MSGSVSAWSDGSSDSRISPVRAGSVSSTVGCSFSGSVGGGVVEAVFYYVIGVSSGLSSRERVRCARRSSAAFCRWRMIILVDEEELPYFRSRSRCFFCFSTSRLYFFRALIRSRRLRGFSPSKPAEEVLFLSRELELALPRFFLPLDCAFLSSSASGGYSRNRKRKAFSAPS